MSGVRPLVGSLFSGAGGFDVGFERAGFEVAWQIEIDRDCVSVLERHWPAVRRYGDVQAVDPTELAPVDVVIFGSPCQDFSVAGKRAGLDGERSGLFGEAIRIIRGLRPAPALCVWENVPGALSSARGRDFGAVLDALADAGALDIAWRVLDARWFGVPQRRRRIFLVADFGAERAGSVLFESEGGVGDSQASGAAGEGVAGDAEGSSGEPRAWSTKIANTRSNQAGKLYAEYTPALAANSPAPAVAGVADVAFTLRRNNNGTGSSDNAWNTTYVPVAGDVSWKRRGGYGYSETDGVAPTLEAEGGTHTGGPMAVPLVSAIAFDWQKGGGGNDHSWRGKSREWIERAGDYAGSLSATKHDAVAISENQRAELRETPYARQLTNGGGKAGQGYPAVREGMAVRRLTPREAERLQGWPDDHTRWRADGQEISDGPRYRMVGNGVATPVATWIATRIREALT